jgi:Flp pilus assembly protein TadG
MLTALLAIHRRSTKNARRQHGQAAGTGFRKDTRAVAAVEFALVVTVLLLMLLGICDVVPTWLVSTNVATAASTAADVAGEFSEMQTSDMVNVYSAAADVMSPFSATNQSLRITNVFSDGNGNAKVYWSCGNGNLAPYGALSTVTTTPTGSPVAAFVWLYNFNSGGYQLNGTNTGYVFAEVSYSYSAPAQFVLRNAINMSGVAYYTPRSSSYVAFPWDGISTDAPTVPTLATKSMSVQLSNGATCNYAN